MKNSEFHQKQVTIHADWLHTLAIQAGKGTVDRIDGRALNRIANMLDQLLEENIQLKKSLVANRME